MQIIIYFVQAYISIDETALAGYNRNDSDLNKLRLSPYERKQNTMDNEKNIYEPDILSVTDENGNEILFELLERYETDDAVYVAITEYRDDAEEIVEADYEVIILKVLEENGEEYLEEIEDEMEYEQISDILMAKVEEKYEVEYFEPEQ